MSLSSQRQHASSSQDELEFNEKLERRRSVVESEGASWESTPAQRAADEGATLAELDRAARTSLMSNGKWTFRRGQDSVGASPVSCADSNSCDYDGSYGGFSSGGDFRYVPTPFWNELYVHFPPRRSADSVEDTHESGPRCHLDLSKSFVITLDKSDSDCLGLDLRLRRVSGGCEAAATKAWVIKSIDAGLVEAWNSSNPSEQVRVGDRLIEVNGVNDASMLLEECGKGPSLELRLWRSADIKEECREEASTVIKHDAELDDGSIHVLGMSSWDREDDIELAANETWSSSDGQARSQADDCPSEEGASTTLESFLKNVPRSFVGVHSRVGKWKKRPSWAPTISKGNVQRRLSFVKSKASKFAVQTRNGFVSMQAVPSKVSTKTRRRAAEAKALTLQLSQRAEEGFEKIRDRAGSTQPLQGLRNVKEQAENCLVAPAIVSEKAHRGVAFAKEKAQLASTAFVQMSQTAEAASKRLDPIGAQMCQAARKGRAFAMNLGGFGGA